MVQNVLTATVQEVFHVLKMVSAVKKGVLLVGPSLTLIDVI